MLAEIGLFATFFAFLASIYAIFASFYGERFARSEAVVLSGRNAVFLTFALLTVAAGSLQLGLMTQQYQIKYVWSVSSPDMPTFFRFTALWGSQAGSLLFWSFLMSVFAAAAVKLNWFCFPKIRLTAGGLCRIILAISKSSNPH
jgi:cytochrome c-type biogenesis protein CcmF